MEGTSRRTRREVSPGQDAPSIPVPETAPGARGFPGRGKMPRIAKGRASAPLPAPPCDGRHIAQAQEGGTISPDRKDLIVRTPVYGAEAARATASAP